MSSALELVVLLTLKDEASKALDGIKERFHGVGVAAAALGTVALAGVAALGKGLYDAAQAAAEEEVGIAKLGAAVKASGADWDVASSAIEDTIAALRRKTALDDGEAREAVARLTMTTGEYTEALQLLPLALDLATAKNMDLNSAAELVGRVAEGNTGILSRYGIVLEEGASATDALRAMQEKFGGQAEAFGATYAGQQARLQGALGDLKETIGTLVLPAMTQFAEAGADLAQRAIPVLENAVVALRPTFDAVFGFLRDPVLPIMVSVFDWVMLHWPEISAAISVALNTAWDVFQAVFGWINENVIPILRTAVNWVKENWPEISAVISAVLGAVWDILRDVFGWIVENVIPILRDVVGWVEGNWPQVSAVMNAVLGETWEFAKTVFGWFGSDVIPQLEKSYNWISQVWPSVKAALVDPVEAAKSLIEAAFGAISRLFENFRLPHIPTPHFGVSWNEIGLGVSLPSISVDWYGSGGQFIVPRPTLIGVGESGAELVTVIPLGGEGAGLPYVQSPVTTGDYPTVIPIPVPAGGSGDVVGIPMPVGGIMTLPPPTSGIKPPTDYGGGLVGEPLVSVPVQPGVLTIPSKSPGVVSVPTPVTSPRPLVQPAPQPIPIPPGTPYAVGKVTPGAGAQAGGTTTPAVSGGGERVGAGGNALSGVEELLSQILTSVRNIEGAVLSLGGGTGGVARDLELMVRLA